jgi:hypothetical protein
MEHLKTFEKKSGPVSTIECAVLYRFAEALGLDGVGSIEVG